MLDRVTAHAVIRYLERVLGLPVADWLRDYGHLPENLRAELCCERAGLPVAAVRQSILIQPVQMAVLAGFKDVVVRVDGFAYVIRHGNVVTILTEEMRDHNLLLERKLKPKSQCESRREFARMNRRNKARNKSRNRRRMEGV